MKCDSCPEKATVFYTQVIGGELKKFVLCESCAQKQGIMNPEGLLMGEEFLGGDATPTPAPTMSKEQPDGGRQCPDCDFTVDDFQKVGRLGCPSCYHFFQDIIEERLPSFHRGVEHQGYFPDGMVREEAIRIKHADLSDRLEAAILEERFEEAARLRDEIDAIEKDEKEVLI